MYKSDWLISHNANDHFEQRMHVMKSFKQINGKETNVE